METANESCPSCGRPFSPGEVTGFGVLRSRPAERGGPLMDFACPRCRRVLRLIPHGHGRYAFPGEPPPPPVPPAERAPPWIREDPEFDPSSPESPDEVSAPAAEPIEVEVPAEPPREERPRGVVADDEPITATVALEILDLSPTADRMAIERAFRDKSRLCHPDKVSHLDTEFQELAHWKFRRLREAYELLVDGGEASKPG